MQQRTGSVYLDAPIRASRVPTKSPAGIRARGAALLVGIGVVAVTITAVIIGLRLLVIDAEPSLRAFDSMLDDPLAREEIQAELAVGIENGLVGDDLAAVAAAYGLDVTEEANRVSGLVLDDELVRAELHAVAAEIHSRVTVEHDPDVVDLTALSTAVRAVIEANSPRLASIIPADAMLWTIDGDTLPDFTTAADLAARTLRASLLASLLVPIGLALHPRRHPLAGWIGRWVVGFGLICAIAAVALPYLIGELTGYRSAEIAVRSVSLKLLAPAVLSGIVGIGLTSFAGVLRKREQRRVTDEGAAAALGYNEPPFWQQTSTPSLDLPSRGLVDAGHPLTNI
ncbi:MAG: hypothetical protein R2707_18555 [Acidimicrobiales bacterium]